MNHILPLNLPVIRSKVELRCHSDMVVGAVAHSLHVRCFFCSPDRRILGRMMTTHLSYHHRIPVKNLNHLLEHQVQAVVVWKLKNWNMRWSVNNLCSGLRIWIPSHYKWLLAGSPCFEQFLESMTWKPFSLWQRWEKLLWYKFAHTRLQCVFKIELHYIFSELELSSLIIDIKRPPE